MELGAEKGFTSFDAFVFCGHWCGSSGDDGCMTRGL